MIKRLLAGALLFLAFPPGVDAQWITRHVTDGTTTSSRQVPLPGEIIIELAAPPLLASGARSAAELDGLLQRLERDIATIERGRVAAKSGAVPQPALRHRYTRTFAGASARVSPEAVEQIRQLSYVRRVHPDRVVNALLHESVEQVGATAIWQQYGALGSGVVVAVVDTGIDYTHPALGGGFGPAARVRGGKDFVNEDDDPMDDHGHGTHVAGIVAASGGGLTGVAPAASLLAYKVLDASGSGRDSSVLAAVEEISRQKPDIVNMSLGREAVTDDPVVSAIENASLAGVLFVVAAGNSGDFLDIGSPANAPSAVTVGAIDREGRLAPFSSKGPVVPTGAMKPEVVAPGVGIVSARNGGGTRVASGTSMAAPHVAGVAALLRELRALWPAAAIRAALIGSARPIDAELMAAGAGQVHAVDAVRKVLQPSVNAISFGISDQTQDVWTASRTIALTSLSGDSQSLDVSIDGLREGIEITPSATMITTGQPLTLELRVDRSKVPSPEFGSLSFGGFVRFSGTLGSLAVPWTFVSASRVRVRWTGSGESDVQLGTSRMSVAGSARAQSAGVDLFIGAGPVSLWLRGTAKNETATYHVIRDNLDLSKTSEITIGPADAPYRITFAGADAFGRPLADRGAFSVREMLISHPHFQRDLLDSLVYVHSSGELFFSPMPATTRILAFERTFDFDPYVVWAAQYEPVEGVDDNVELTIPPAAWKALSARGVVPADLSNPYRAIYASLWVKTDRQMIVSFVHPPLDEPPLAGDTRIEAWITSPVENDSGAGVIVEIGAGSGLASGFPMSTPELTAQFTSVADGIIPGNDRPPRISARIIPSREPITIGEGPAFPTAMVGAFESSMFAGVRWLGPHDEERLYDVKRMKADLYDAAGTLIASGQPPPSVPGLPLGPSPGFQMITELPSAGAYRFEAMTSSFHVAGVPARGTLRVVFDTERDDSVAPALTSLRIHDGSGRAATTMTSVSTATLTFSAVDLGLHGIGDLRRERTAVHYRPHGSGDNGWAALAPVVVADDLSSGAGGFLTRIPDGLLYQVPLAGIGSAKGAIDLRIHVEDAEGNSTTYVVEPAFVVVAARPRAVGR